MTLPTLNLSVLDRAKGSGEELTALVDYVITLNKTLKDILNNLDEDNFSDTYFKRIIKNEQSVSEYLQTADAIMLRINNTKVVINENTGVTCYNGGFRIFNGTSNVFEANVDGNVYYSGQLNGAGGTFSGTLVSVNGIAAIGGIAFYDQMSNHGGSIGAFPYYLGGTVLVISGSPNISLAGNVTANSLDTNDFTFNSRTVYQSTVRDYSGNYINVLSYY